ncbi:unnamed protein product, partial [Owenia fusiformis]
KDEVLEPIMFSVYDPALNTDVFTRQQVPLKVNYAVTCHKTQASTLPKVVVHCDNVNMPGQLGVAIGRVRRKEDVKLVNFRPNCIVRQPMHVLNFIRTVKEQNVEDTLKRDLTCCTGKKWQTATTSHSSFAHPPPSDPPTTPHSTLPPLPHSATLAATHSDIHPSSHSVPPTA